LKIIQKLILVLVVILFPLFIVTCSIRVALTPFYIQVEYNRPGFPADAYGFTTADRLQWGQYSIDYLLGKVADCDFTAQTLPDGTPLFNARELSHMQDVRDLTLVVLQIWKRVVRILRACAIRQPGRKWSGQFLRALRDGALATIALIAAILAAVWMNFNLLFTQFHQLFFEGDSWLFYLSDHLIRLFPLTFWQDLFIFIGAVTILFCLIPILLSRLKKHS
jgi:integral membrane protein TIGR01906